MISFMSVHFLFGDCGQTVKKEVTILAISFQHCRCMCLYFVWQKFMMIQPLVASLRIINVIKTDYCVLDVTAMSFLFWVSSENWKSEVNRLGLQEYFTLKLIDYGTDFNDISICIYVSFVWKHQNTNNFSTLETLMILSSLFLIYKMECIFQYNVENLMSISLSVFTVNRWTYIFFIIKIK